MSFNARELRTNILTTKLATQYAKILCLLCVAFIEIQYQVAGVAISATEVLIAVSFLATCYELWRNGGIGYSLSLRENRVLLGAYGSYVAVFAILIAYQYNYDIAQILKYYAVLFMGLMALFTFYIEDDDKVSYRTYLTVLVIVASIAIVVSTTRLIGVPHKELRLGSAFWGESNRMATRLLVLLPAAFYMAKYKSKYYYIAFYIMTFGIFMAVSRAAIAVMAVFILFNIVEFFKKKNILITIAGCAANAAMLQYFDSLNFLAYRMAVLGEEFRVSIGMAKVAPNSAVGPLSRTVLWEQAWQTFLSNPFVGVGIEQYRGFYKVYGEIRYMINAHNWIMQVLAEAGIVGLSVTVLLIGVVLWMFYKGYKAAVKDQDVDRRMVSMIGGWALLLFLGHNAVEASANTLLFANGSVSVVLLMVLGICLGYNNRKLGMSN